MYQIDDLIIYGGEGVCRVTAVGEPPLPGLHQGRTYYTLEPLYHGGVIYAPADVAVPMRSVLSEEEAWALIRRIPEMPDTVVQSMDPKQTEAAYKSYLRSYACEDLLHLIRTIYSKNETAITLGKSYGQIDDRFLKRAKTLLYGELAVSLGIPTEEVEDLIVLTIEG